MTSEPIVRLKRPFTIVLHSSVLVVEVANEVLEPELSRVARQETIEDSGRFLAILVFTWKMMIAFKLRSLLSFPYTSVSSRPKHL